MYLGVYCQTRVYGYMQYEYLSSNWPMKAIRDWGQRQATGIKYTSLEVCGEFYCTIALKTKLIIKALMSNMISCRSLGRMSCFARKSID